MLKWYEKYMISALFLKIICSNQKYIPLQHFSWRTTGQETPGAQIDLLIDRADRCVNLCEMKFSRGEYEITKTEREKIENRATRFMQYAEPRKSIRLTMITSFGLKPNTQSSIIQSQITLDDLFHA